MQVEGPELGAEVTLGFRGGIGFAEAFAMHCVHFALSGRGDQGDVAALFQIAQDALTRSLNDELYIFLGGLGSGLEEGRGRFCSTAGRSMPPPRGPKEEKPQGSKTESNQPLPPEIG